MPYLFSYGTLQTAQVQRDTFGRLLNGKADALVGFSKSMVEITDEAVLASSGERFHPIVSRSDNPKDQVVGTVFDVTQAELLQADEYEVEDYKREEVKLASGRRAWLYVKALI